MKFGWLNEIPVGKWETCPIMCVDLKFTHAVSGDHERYLLGKFSHVNRMSIVPPSKCP